MSELLLSKLQNCGNCGNLNRQKLMSRDAGFLVCDNKFISGTNIQSLKQLITFDIPSTIFENVGLMNVEAECVG